MSADITVPPLPAGRTPADYALEHAEYLAAHFGAEFWTRHDAKTEFPDRAERLLTSFADAAIDAATSQEGEVSPHADRC
jgi:hypothetical protein